MAIEGLNHYNIIAPSQLMVEVREFYITIVGLEEGYRPDFGVPGHWLYAGNSPVLHLMDANAMQWTGNPSGETGTGNLDHIAFNASDLSATEAKLIDQGQDYRKSEHPDFNLTQLFLRDPIGLGIELNFSTS